MRSNAPPCSSAANRTRRVPESDTTRRGIKNTGIPLEWIKDAGHNSNTDQPKIVNQLIEQLAQRAKCLEV